MSTNTNNTVVTDVTSSQVVANPVVKSVRGLKIALTRKANQLNVKITNLVITDNVVEFAIDPNIADIYNQLAAIVIKLGYARYNNFTYSN